MNSADHRQQPLDPKCVFDLTAIFRGALAVIGLFT